MLLDKSEMQSFATATFGGWIGGQKSQFAMTMGADTKLPNGSLGEFGTIHFLLNVISILKSN